MTVRNPLVLIPGGNPQIQELPTGDSIGGAPQGPVGMTWQGAWSSGTSYVIDDAVSNNGSSYIAIAPSTNQAPPNATYWNVLSSAGSAGSAATVSVGTTTTGAAGSSASVTNSGSSSAAVFNFTIPKGDTGATGAPGGMGAQLAQIITSGSQTTVDFTSISGSYTSLRVLWNGRDTASGTSLSRLRVTFNNDTTAANYTSTGRIGAENAVAFATVTTSSTKGVECGFMPNDGNTAGIIGVGELIIPNYTGTTFFKRFMASYGCDTGSVNTDVALATARWASTSAITRVTFSTDGTAFKNGLVFTLYGMT